MNQKGFSLVEVLMAAGIVGGIALTVAKLSQDSARVTKTTETNNEINNFMSDVSYILSDKESCNATIAGSETIGSPISAIKKVSNGSITNVYELDPKKYGNNSFSVVSMRTTLADGGVSLLFDINRANLTTLGSRQITKKLPLKAVIEDGKIKSCFSDTESMIESAVRAACKGNSARFDENLKECHHHLQILVCEPGKVMQQIVTEDGTIKSECVPIIPTPMNCPIGEFIKSITVDGATTCEPLNTKNGACGVGQYAYQLNNGELRCRDIPKCGGGNRSLLTSDASTGELKCAPLLCDPANQYFAGFNSAGTVVCKNFPDKSCGQGQYIKEVKTDGSIECGEVPNHVSLPQSDYAFVDGFDTSTKTWSRKSLTQTAQKICESFIGTTWTGTKCNVNIPTQITSEDVCNSIEGGSWNGEKCEVKKAGSLKNCAWTSEELINNASRFSIRCPVNKVVVSGSCDCSGTNCNANTGSLTSSLAINLGGSSTTCSGYASTCPISGCSGTNCNAWSCDYYGATLGTIYTKAFCCEVE